jgi:hypothetical protein
MPTLTSFIGKLATVVVNPLIKLMFAAALIVFLWGVFTYVKNADNADERETGRSHIIWGLVGMLIMVSVFTIIDIALNSVYG